MSWKSDLSIKRIYNTFKRVQVFQQDVDALKNLNETISENENKYMVDNILFAKLLCYVLNQNLHYHKSMKMSISEVAEVFKKPLDNHLEILTVNLNNQDLNNYLKNIGIDFKKFETDKTIVKDHSKELIEKLKSNYSKKVVEKSFCNTVNEFLKQPENYI